MTASTRTDAPQLVYTAGHESPGERLAPTRSRRQLLELILHLTRRELDSSHRNTVLGWAWPLARQLAQLGVLVFVFSSILSLGIPHFAVFVFSGLVAFGWFSSGISAATQSLLGGRHLMLQPRFPGIVLPIVALAVPFVDLLLALPVLIAMAAGSGHLQPTVVLLPLVLAVQLVLMAGLAWLTAATTVYVRDVPQIVTVALTLTFYLTPVFYSVQRIPSRYSWVLKANPLTDIVEAWRAVLLGSPFPGLVATAYVLVVSAVLAAAGYLYFRRHADRLVDHL